MTYDVSKLPAVRAQLERDLGAQVQPKAEPTPGALEYARAPAAPGAPHGTGRPPAVQGTKR